MKRAALINDLSGVGRCSLSVALPIVSACGHECAVLPTALLSNHTGFENYTFFDFTEHMRGFIDCWEQLGISFDMIYSGFLGSGIQADITLELIDRLGKNAVRLVDPVLGDNGRLYDTCSDISEHMRKLIRAADVITPNLTELCALCKREYPESPIQIADIEQMCSQLPVDSIVVTGLEQDTVLEIPPCRVANLVYESGSITITDNEKFPAAYCGTGDVFASVLCGGLTSGKTLTAAVCAAADFTQKCVRDTYNNGNYGKDKLYGVQFEDKLNLLKECF
jgi:pyridoxine kinase